jgi:bifunctional pyridoxal-dependent enzyme with beta-cystathionase and maltose regulon repressor activities
MYPTELALLGTKVMYSDLGRAWLTQIRTLIRQNYVFMQKWLKLFLPKVQVMELESTYLAMLDFSHYVGSGQ